jgi:hypothetical protein
MLVAIDRRSAATARKRISLEILGVFCGKFRVFESALVVPRAS